MTTPSKYKYIPDVSAAIHPDRESSDVLTVFCFRQSEIQLLNSLAPVQYHPAELLAYAFAVSHFHLPARTSLTWLQEPYISPLLVQAVDNNGKPSDISLSKSRAYRCDPYHLRAHALSVELIEYSGTPQEIAHPIFTFKSNRYVYKFLIAIGELIVMLAPL